MKRVDLAELHYIVPLTNVPSVLTHGLLSHRRVENMDPKPVSVANADVQRRRANKRLPSGLWLHEYVNMYFCARNAMMYAIVMDQSLQNKPCVLRISTDVLDIAGTLVTDRNAASGIARIAEPVAGLARLDYKRVFAQSWIHPGDRAATDDHKQVMCAEVLVPHRVGPTYIVGAYVPGVLEQKALMGIVPQLEVTVNSRLFFK